VYLRAGEIEKCRKFLQVGLNNEALQPALSVVLAKLVMRLKVPVTKKTPAVSAAVLADITSLLKQSSGVVTEPAAAAEPETAVVDVSVLLTNAITALQSCAESRSSLPHAIATARCLLVVDSVASGFPGGAAPPTVPAAVTEKIATLMEIDGLVNRDIGRGGVVENVAEALRFLQTTFGCDAAVTTAFEAKSKARYPNANSMAAAAAEGDAKESS
jgi:hypothetical protein